MLLLVVLGCPTPAVSTPAAVRGVWVPSGPTALSALIVGDASLRSPHREDRLLLVAAHLEADGTWVATSAAEREPCEGSVRITEAEIVVDTRGPAACSAWAGRWIRRLPVVLAAPPDAAVECRRYRDCVCALAADPPPEAPFDPFAASCARAERWEVGPGDASACLALLSFAVLGAVEPLPSPCAPERSASSAAGG